MHCQVCSSPVYGSLCDECVAKIKLYNELRPRLDRLLEILDIEEESEMTGESFRPVYISCCRVLLCVELDSIFSDLKKMKIGNGSV